MSDETLMLLGGSRYLLPVIEAAHERGLKVVTCDNIPTNIAHTFADEYRNVSIVDEEAVLRTAREVGAIGILSFAADPGVVAASYAAEALGLPFQSSYEVTKILQSKDRFREFLQHHGFNCPWAVTVRSTTEGMRDSASFPYPVIVKPVDSAGSKGVTRVDRSEDLGSALQVAFGFSRSGVCIVEQFIEKLGFSSDADSFTVDGKFECFSFTSQIFDEGSENPYVPAAYAMPDELEPHARRYLQDELQRLADLLSLGNGIYNIEVRVGLDGTPYIMEVSPRGGGNRLAELLRAASGVDLIRAAVEGAVGVRPSGVRAPEFDGIWYEQVLFSRESGTFVALDIDEDLRREHLRDESVWISPGDPVHRFSSANHAFGSLFMRFDDRSQLDDYLESKDQLVKVRLR